MPARVSAPPTSDSALPSQSWLPGSGATVAATAPVAINKTFSVTKQCPQGGSVVIAGTIVGTGDQATRSLTVDATATRTDTGCAFQTDDGVITVNGTPNIAYTSHLTIVNGMLSGLQTQTHKAAFTWARGSGSPSPALSISPRSTTRLLASRR